MQNLVLWRGYLTFTIITVGDSSISTLTVPIIFLPSILRFGYKFNTLAGVARHLSGPRWIAASRAWKMTFPAPTSSSSSLFPVTYTWDPHVQLSPTSSHQALRTELSPAARARGGARAGGPPAHARSPSSGLVPVRVGLLRSSSATRIAGGRESH
jgi:hypothetical protein